MARKQASPKLFGDSFFADVPLSADDKRSIRERSGDAEWLLQATCNAVSEGFKFAANRDDRNGTFVVSLSWKSVSPTGSVRYVILTGRGSDPAIAWSALLYKHDMLSDGLWVDQAANDGLADDIR